jgi:hypothetical protein
MPRLNKQPIRIGIKSQLPAGPLKDQLAGARNPMVFVKLAPNRDGICEAISVHVNED